MANKSRALYFVFEPTVGEPVDEVTIWMNGGPGCSSLEAFFQENGRFIWSWGMYTPQINPYSWVNLTKVLWVEQPVGTGFSIGEVTATSEEDVAEDFVNSFLNFQRTFGIKNFKIYGTGESYAGRYVPYISLAMLEKNDTEYFDVSGALAYHPVIESYVYAQQQVPAVPFLLQNNNILGLNSTFIAHLEALHQSCGYSDFLTQYLTFPPSGIQPPKYFDDHNANDLACDLWGSIYHAAYGLNPCFNVYEVSTQCPFLSDPLGYPTDLQYLYPGFEQIYFNRSDVKKAMHAPSEISWNECSGPVFLGTSGPEQEGDLSADPIQRGTNRVLIANGALDFEILTNGTLLAIQNMTWGGKLGFQWKPTKPIVIKLPDLQYGGLFIEQGAYAEPRSSYRHLQWVLGRIEEL
ncbi:putative pheromone processing carboxypeptidase (Sxa2) [Sclerotinia borealis F-4128]|uniref:Putative pheromone processing carboxypeptidase (Sxa2) n=1 Tax=Sclerotinia borealis (strain F-4128) TaxID=1432307 RepID=W9C9J9_SCLBF|nr:putative pheromone processing carboxypeptidase (Sxa2) [Sclerotinia borealis F-4128]